MMRLGGVAGVLALVVAATGMSACGSSNDGSSRARDLQIQRAKQERLARERAARRRARVRKARLRARRAQQTETTQQPTPAPKPTVNPHCPAGMEPNASGGCEPYNEENGQVEPKISDPRCYSDKPPNGCF